MGIDNTIENVHCTITGPSKRLNFHLLEIQLSKNCGAGNGVFPTDIEPMLTTARLQAGLLDPFISLKVKMRYLAGIWLESWIGLLGTRSKP